MMTIEDVYSKYLECSCVCTDSRNITPGSLFVALHGENFNANQFAEQALKTGSKYALVDDKNFAADPCCLLVDDTLKALQDIARIHRSKLKIPVIGITGTNGKTTTKEIMAAILSKKYRVAFTKGNFNNHIGVPLTLLSVKDEEIAIVEMGANHPGEIAMLCKIASPDLGIITNIGKAHLEGFGSLEGVVKTKKELYDSIRLSHGKVFVCRDNSLLMNISEGIERILYGVFPDSKCRGEISECNPLLKLKWFSGSGIIDISTNLFGFYNFENVMAAVCVGNYFGVDDVKIKEAIGNYFPSNNRSQIIRTEKNVIIMDAYNANPTSMNAAVQNFIHVSAEKKFAVIGDMRELGGDAEDEHKKILDLITDAGFDKVILVGPVFSTINQNETLMSFLNSDDARDYLKKNKPSGYHILIKGSRGIKLENVLEAL
jgi:UDP-N-acetylmuramoyl-tripeptide--D-alanyl-D-alanine ligase